MDMCGMVRVTRKSQAVGVWGHVWIRGWSLDTLGEFVVGVNGSQKTPSC